MFHFFLGNAPLFEFSIGLSGLVYSHIRDDGEHNFGLTMDRNAYFVLLSSTHALRGAMGGGGGFIHFLYFLIFFL